MLTLEIIKILADKKPRSVSEIMELTGQPRQKIHNAFTSLLHHGLSKAEPVRYTVTERGAKRAAWRPQTKREKLDKQNLKMRERRAAAQRAKQRIAAREARDAEAGKTESGFIHKLVDAKLARDSIVSRAIETRHPLQSAWGSMP